MRRVIEGGSYSAVWLAALALFSLASAACSHTTYLYEDHPLVGAAFETRTGMRLTDAELERRLIGQDFVLLGEVHDNPKHHLGQAHVVSTVIKSAPEATVFFEQLTDDQGPALRSLVKRGGVRALEIGRAVAWEKSGWPAFSMYEPIFEAALAGGAVIDPALFSTKTMGQVYRDGMGAVIDAQDLDAYSLNSLPQGKQDVLEKIIFSSHCGLIDRSGAARMSEVQKAKDAFMAVRMVKNKAKGPALLIAGGGHTRTDLGVPWYLAQMGQAKVVSLAYVEVDPKDLTPSDYQPYLTHDLVVFTAAAQRDDPCEAMRAMRKGKLRREVPDPPKNVQRDVGN